MHKLSDYIIKTHFDGRTGTSAFPVFLLRNRSSPSIATQDPCEVIEDALHGRKPCLCITQWD
jgi:hypothetical protein